MNISCVVLAASLLLPLQQSAPRAPSRIDTLAGGFEKALPSVITLVWAQLTRDRPAASFKGQPKYRVVDGPITTAPVLDGDTVVITKSYLIGIELLGSTLAHDVYTQEFGTFPSVDQNTPAILKQAQLLSQWPVSIDTVQQLSVQPASVICADAETTCGNVTVAGMALTTMFVLGHELAHLYNGDADGPRQLTTEMRADDAAIGALEAIRAQLVDGTGTGSYARAVGTMAWVAPLMILDFQRSSAESDAADDEILERRRRIQDRMSADQRQAIALYMPPTKGALQTIHIDSAIGVDWIAVDGVDLDPKAVVARDLKLRRSEHVVAAGAAGAIAYGHVAEDADTSVVPLVFHSLRPADDRAEIVQLLNRGQWLEALTRTADRYLQPRNDGVALLHWKALHRLGLNEIAVNLPDVGDPTAEDVKKVEAYGKSVGSVTNIFRRQKYHQLAESGDVLAQLVLAFAYFTGGDDLAVNMSASVRLFRQAAEQGSNLARVNLGKILADGTGGVPIDRTESRKWYTLAAEDGYPAAQFALGLIYDRGIGVQADALRALYWYKLAAQQGNKVAPCNIGLLYDLGTVFKDDAEAVRWYTLGAERNDEDAQYDLGLHYRSGSGIAADPRQAYVWFSIASENGHKEAGPAASEIRASLSTKDVADADATVKAWFAASRR